MEFKKKNSFRTSKRRLRTKDTREIFISLSIDIKILSGECRILDYQKELNKYTIGGDIDTRHRYNSKR
jgi:hypothetical protein